MACARALSAHRTWWSRSCGPRERPLRECPHRGSEHLAAMVVVAEHVEASARGREQHGISGLRSRRGGAHGFGQRGGVLDRANTLERRLDGGGVAADEHGALDLAAERRGERREVLTL